MITDKYGWKINIWLGTYIDVLVELNVEILSDAGIILPDTHQHIYITFYIQVRSVVTNRSAVNL